MAYGVKHENLTRDIWQEPGVLDAFAKVSDTDSLIASFDAVNFPSRPVKTRERTNGPEDGGLVVFKGTHLLSKEFHEEFMESDKVWI
ncbi:Uu.00g107460.m01.CDS01 [Anthostomella pinea]|uniref:Uu.00g107460.m01.CDS01 n=1 Tax=Anthostomella pinea TaxID=933095 RepID=A0AAI8VFC6_9PEZI|nr:Uu.00g107460.m01.CDS01 [Anthostomella pinea]